MEPEAERVVVTEGGAEGDAEERECDDNRGDDTREGPAEARRRPGEPPHLRLFRRGDDGGGFVAASGAASHTDGREARREDQSGDGAWEAE